MSLRPHDFDNIAQEVITPPRTGDDELATKTEALREKLRVREDRITTPRYDRAAKMKKKQ